MDLFRCGAKVSLHLSNLQQKGGRALLRTWKISRYSWQVTSDVGSLTSARNIRAPTPTLPLVPANQVPRRTCLTPSILPNRHLTA